ncbi:Pentatricopeptide repeat-containing protein At4g16835, mitochondrial [Linum perenne]
MSVGPKFDAIIRSLSILHHCFPYLALLEKGKQIHGHVVKSFNREDFGSVYANNALLDMYCKCGDMRSSKKLFEGMVKKDVVSWNSMINGFAHNGLADESLIVFKEMVQGSTMPNHVTFLGVLSACSHTGSLSEALRILEQMEKDYHICPRSEHYAVLIDLLGRKNRLSEAMEFVERTPVLSDHVGIWGALLGACRIHQNVNLAMKAAETLFKMEPSNPGRYVMLTNIYTAANKWSDACKVRREVEEKGLLKDVAYSWIEDNPVLQTLSKLMNDQNFVYAAIHNISEVLHIFCSCLTSSAFFL